MKKTIYCIFIFVFSTLYVKSQEEEGGINTGAANFLLINSDARNAGMGGAGAALTKNNNTIFYNAASVLGNSECNGGATYSFIPWMRGYESVYSLQSVGGFYKMDNRNAFLGGFRYYNYPKFTIIENKEKTDEKIHPREWAIDIGYAREVAENLSVSATFRYIYSYMGNIGSVKAAGAVAFDIGAFYNRDILEMEGANWAMGLQVSNIGSKIKYLDRKENLPSIAKLGGAVNLPFSSMHKFLVTADLGFRFMPSDTQSFNINTGMEYVLIEHIAFRGGYHYGDKDKGDVNYATGGGGLNYDGFNLDFAWLFTEKESALRNSFLISLGFSF